MTHSFGACLSTSGTVLVVPFRSSWRKTVCHRICVWWLEGGNQSSCKRCGSGRDDRSVNRWMLPDQIPFFIRELFGLVQYGFGNEELAHIVQQSCLADLTQPLRVAIPQCVDQRHLPRRQVHHVCRSVEVVIRGYKQVRERCRIIDDQRRDGARNGLEPRRRHGPSGGHSACTRGPTAVVVAGATPCYDPCMLSNGA